MSNISTSISGDIRLTRITNACVLIEMGDHAVLTDPWFRNPWGFNEEQGIAVKDLPRLTAVIGSHFAPDHWGIGDLRTYPHLRQTPAFTATPGMARKARKIGFRSGECLEWNETRELAPGLTLEVVEAQQFLHLRSNNYVLSYAGNRVFFGGETRELGPLTRYSAKNDPVDVVLAPSNGQELFGFRLVATAEEGFVAARILGGNTFIPIHDSMHNIGFGGPTSSSSDLKDRVDDRPHIVFLDAGKKTQMAKK